MEKVATVSALCAHFSPRHVSFHCHFRDVGCSKFTKKCLENPVGNCKWNTELNSYSVSSTPALIPVLKFPPFLAACWAPLCTHSRSKVFLNEFFLVKKVKNISEMEWNSSVCFTVDKENCGEPAKQQRKGQNRTRRKLILCFLSELLCLPFISLSLYWNRPFYLNSLIFNCALRTNS